MIRRADRPGAGSISLRTRVLVTSLGAAALIVAGFLTLVILSFQARSELAQAMDDFAEEERIADAVTLHLMDQLAAAFMLRAGRPDIQPGRFEAAGRRAHTEIRRYLFRDLSPEERLQLEAMGEAHQLMEVAAMRAAELSLRGADEEAEAAWEEMLRRTQEFNLGLSTFLEMRAGAMEVLSEQQRRTFVNLFVASGGLGLLVLGSALALTWMIQRKVARPLSILGEASDRLGRGDLTVRVPIWPERELATLSQGFNRMAESLEKATGDLEERNRELTGALESLQRAQEELVRSEKLGALGRMSAGLAHELNNPLTTVLGYSRILEERLEGAEVLDPTELADLRTEVVAPIRAEAVRAQHLVRNLLHFSRRSEIKVAPVRLREAMDVVAALKAGSFRQAGVKLQVDPLPSDPVLAEPHLLQSVFLNLLNNALDAMEGLETGTVRVHGEREGASVRVYVEDEGPGLTAPDRIFEPFFTTKETGEGTGLGLALVHRFMERFGGEVQAENRRGGGARFILTFQVAAEPEEAPTLRKRPQERERPSPVPHVPSAGHRMAAILVVEDEAPIRKLHAQLLKRLNARPHLAASAEEARRILEVEEVDGVICDVKMPGEGGLEFYQWLLSHHPDLARRFLFVTGDVGDPELITLLEERPDLFLHKPFDVSEYLDRVRAVFPET